ncbi:ParB/RepB/Spo0J family partition protein [Micromonospora sp. A3M-1-15]|nr:ParB/RepB/Spo0J family partition protein [Micromonospora sp. A3M-1-15]MCP3786637.1 ParB/RepB/Spo0J family partition protein [Micromonospora sp. A3M-1-15]
MVNDFADRMKAEQNYSELIDKLPIEQLPVESLQMLDSPRLHGENHEHTRMLASIDAPLPPIIVHRATMRVIDGAHRLGAARIRGDEVIEARMFEGSEREAFVLGVKANIAHGLPLSVAERTTAAERIITSHPSWSDRTIAASTGLSARTIGNIRRRLESQGGAGEQVTARIGRDGRVRPLNNVEGRLKAVSYIKSQPDASLREIAKNAGVSPSTARDVRNRLQRGEDPLPPARCATNRRPGGAHLTLEPKDPPPAPRPNLVSMLQGLKQDPSLRFTDSGRELLRWMFARAIQNNEWDGLVDKVPPHCAYVIANVARQCAQEWQEFAETLEQQGADRSA